MTKHIIETVTFKLNATVTAEQFIKAAQAANAFIASQDGFVARRLSHTPEGEWIEHIEWETMEAAQNAAQMLGKVEANGPFLAAIDGPSVVMRHSTLAVSVA
ncbi:MAG: hypothetical protein RIC24_07925 [Hyphomicrobiales bacterium]|jgi:heme-degrading monooxygenase HmoA